MAVQLRYRACPDIADNPPLSQPCKEMLHPYTIEAMDIIILLLVVSQSFPTNISYNNPIDIRIIVSLYWEQQSVDCESLTPTRGATPKRGL